MGPDSGCTETVGTRPENLETNDQSFSLWKGNSENLYQEFFKHKHYREVDVAYMII